MYAGRPWTWILCATGAIVACGCTGPLGTGDSGTTVRMHVPYAAVAAVLIDWERTAQEQGVARRQPVVRRNPSLGIELVSLSDQVLVQRSPDKDRVEVRVVQDAGPNGAGLARSTGTIVLSAQREGPQTTQVEVTARSGSGLFAARDVSLERRLLSRIELAAGRAHASADAP